MPKGMCQPVCEDLPGNTVGTVAKACAQCHGPQGRGGYKDVLEALVWGFKIDRMRKVCSVAQGGIKRVSELKDTLLVLDAQGKEGASGIRLKRRSR